MADNDLRAPSAASGNPSREEAEKPGAGSWPGLAPLDAGDAGRLRGRDKELDRLIRLFRRGPSGQTPVVWLTGDAGVGKSSLMAAGLFPRLRDEAGGTLEWIRIQAKKRDSPASLVDATVTALLQRSIEREEERGLDLEGRLRQFRLLMEQDGPEAVEYVASCYQKAADGDLANESRTRCLIFIDDWHELPEGNPKELAELLHFLRELSLAGCFPCAIAIRSHEFPHIQAATEGVGYGEFGTEVPLGPLVFEEVRPFFLSAPSAGAESGTVEVAPALLDLLASDGHGEAGLPFISETLRRLSASDPLADRIGLEDARWAGGIRETFADVAESVMPWGPAHESAFFDLMAALHPVRRYLDREAEQMIHQPETASFAAFVSDPQRRDLVNALVDSRVLSLLGQEASEARVAWAVPQGLLEWERARKWLEENDRLVATINTLEKAREGWEDEHRTPVFLLHSTKALASAEEILEYHGRRALLSESLEAFLRESIRFDGQLNTRWRNLRSKRWLLIGGASLFVAVVLIVVISRW